MKPEPVTAESQTEISPPSFAEVRAMFDACETAGLYAPIDRASLAAMYAMYAMDAAGTAGLVADMAERIDRCSRCAFLRRTDAGRPFCAGRGVQHEIPRDRGAWCAAFHPQGGGRDPPRTPTRRRHGPHGAISGSEAA